MSTLGSRLALGLGDRTQQWLAEKVGVTQTAVSYWLANKRQPELAMVVRVADVLDVGPGWLAFGDAEKAELRAENEQLRAEDDRLAGRQPTADAAVELARLSRYHAMHDGVSKGDRAKIAELCDLIEGYDLDLQTSLIRATLADPDAEDVAE